MTDDPRAIAGRLTKAQRRALLRLPCTEYRVYTHLHGRLSGMASAGLVSCDDLGRWTTTPLGAAVRAIVAAEDGGHE